MQLFDAIENINTCAINPLEIPLSLYIHLPWCEKKCPYCDFNSYKIPDKIPEKIYIERLLADLDAHLPDLSNREIQSIFIGGGTPSLFSPEALDYLLINIKKKISLKNNLEITMEANPGSVESQKFRDFCDLGINRLSLGVQSFQDQKLKLLGRIHDAQAAHQALEKILNAGFKNFNIDLMYGLPTQTLAESINDLKQALSYHPPHLSWYELTIEPNTFFGRFPPKLPQEPRILAMRTQGENFLAEQNYLNYEVSAFAKSNNQINYQCQHNLNYWRYGDYLGIGAGSHSKITLKNNTITRYVKQRTPVRYLNPEIPLISSQTIVKPADLILEFMLNNLRLTAGFDAQKFKIYTGLDIKIILDKLKILADKNWLNLDINNINQIKTTQEGRRFLNEILMEFV